jgi:predicted transcriptional regulator
MRARYLTRTRLILRLLDDRGASTTEQIARAAKMSPSSASTTLLRLVRYGQAKRGKEQTKPVTLDAEERITRPGWVYSYEITAAGAARLKRLEEGA